MSSQEPVNESVELRARNIGGITETAVTLETGVNVLTGRNATNRTSFLQAIMAALGSDNATLKGGAEEGSVTLDIGGETYTRELVREGSSVRLSGNPYLDDPEVADLFAFLLETNEARQAVVRGDDLRELIMRPVDTERIQQEVQELTRERNDVDDRLDALEEKRRRLPELEQERTQLAERIAEKREELEAKEQEVEDADADLEQSREEESELNDRLDNLQDTRSALENARFRLETERESLEALEDEREELEEMLSELPSAPEGELGEIENRIERLRGRKGALESSVSELQSVIGFNEEMLEGEADEVSEALREDDGALTDELVESDEVVCWTCGSEVEHEAIAGTLERLEDYRADVLSERNEVQDELDELKRERNGLRDKREQREQVRQRLERTRSEIADRQDRIADLEAERDELNEEIERLEEAIEELEEQEYEGILSLHKEANQLEFELGRLENEHEDVESRIADLEDELAEEDDLEARREEIAAELEDLRTKVERIEREAVEEFNGHIERVLSLLDYANLDRVWIERVQREVTQGRRKDIRSMFDLHIVRTDDSGATYEDTVAHLSESEREVVGLLFALAGYLTHDVEEVVPFILLDSLEAIDAERIADLIEYMQDHTTYLVAALLPEDAEPLDDRHHYVEEI
jgi:chromosome segregation ATPase